MSKMPHTMQASTPKVKSVPSGPSKPAVTAYQLFLKATQEDIRRKFGSAQAAAQWTSDQISIMGPKSKRLYQANIRMIAIGKLWSKASAEEKSFFQDMSNRLKDVEKASISLDSTVPAAAVESNVADNPGGAGGDTPIGRSRPKGGGKAGKAETGQVHSELKQLSSKKSAAKEEASILNNAAKNGTMSKSTANNVGADVKPSVSGEQSGATSSTMPNAPSGKRASSAGRGTSCITKNTCSSSKRKASTTQSGTTKKRTIVSSSNKLPIEISVSVVNDEDAQGSTKETEGTTLGSGDHTNRHIHLVDADAEAEMENDDEEDEEESIMEKEYPVIGDSAAELASIGLERGVEKEWIEVEWEVQKSGRKAQEWMQWFTASVDLRNPIGFDEQNRPRWIVAYSKCLGLKAAKSKVVFLTGDELLDDFDGAPLNWRKKSDPTKAR